MITPRAPPLQVSVSIYDRDDAGPAAAAATPLWSWEKPATAAAFAEVKHAPVVVPFDTRAVTIRIVTSLPAGKLPQGWGLVLDSSSAAAGSSQQERRWLLGASGDSATGAEYFTEDVSLADAASVVAFALRNGAPAKGSAAKMQHQLQITRAGPPKLVRLTADIRSLSPA